MNEPHDSPLSPPPLPLEVQQRLKGLACSAFPEAEHRAERALNAVEAAYRLGSQREQVLREALEKVLRLVRARYGGHILNDALDAADQALAYVEGTTK